MFRSVEILEKELLEEMGFWGGFTSQAYSKPINIFEIIKIYSSLLVKCVYLIITKKKRWGFNKINNVNLLAVYLTFNQEKAINSWLKYEVNFKSLSNGLSSDYQIPWGRVAWYSLKNIYHAHAIIKKSGNYSLYAPWLEDFVRYLAGKKIALELFNRIQPKFLLFSNDHSGISRGINRVAREKSIRLIYTQHACIGRGFPALNYDLSMLDGMQALEQYMLSGKTTGSVVLTGRQKKIFRKKNREKVNAIGIATNRLDELAFWDKVIKELVRENYKIQLRCHPAEKRIKKWEKIAKKYNIDMHIGGLNNFLNNIDVLIAGLTGTILDAYIEGVASVYMVDKAMRWAQNDYYNFVENEICIPCEEIEALIFSVNKAFDNGVNLKTALKYDLGVQWDPVMLKNKLLQDFIKNVNDLNGDCQFTNYIEHVHMGLVKFYGPEEYILKNY